MQRQSCATGRAANKRIAWPANSFGSSSLGRELGQLPTETVAAHAAAVSNAPAARSSPCPGNTCSNTRDALLVAVQDEPRRELLRLLEVRLEALVELRARERHDALKEAVRPARVEIHDELALAEQRHTLGRALNDAMPRTR